MEIPTACTNYNLPAPTSYHRMVPTCCPDPRMAALSDYIARARPPREVAQLAVWAVANNPGWDEVAGYVETRVQAAGMQQAEAAVEAYRTGAAELLQAVGFRTNEFRMFEAMTQ